MTPTELASLEALAKAATPGPWGWFGSTRTYVYLATRHSGRRFVMAFKRKGLQSAEPTFQVRGEMIPASELAIYEVNPDATTKDDPSVYRHDIVGFRHPDAAYIAAANPAAILSLIEENKRMREALAEAALQIQYLHTKFNATGSGNAVLAKINAALEPQS